MEACPRRDPPAGDRLLGRSPPPLRRVAGGAPISAVAPLTVLLGGRGPSPGAPAALGGIATGVQGAAASRRTAWMIPWAARANSVAATRSGRSPEPW